MNAGLADLLRERRAFVDALQSGNAPASRKQLLFAYLPALREYQALTDPEQITTAIADLEDRLSRGLEYTGSQPDKASDRFDLLLAEYEALSDCHNLSQPAGAPLQPIIYLTDRIEAMCRRSG